MSLFQFKYDGNLKADEIWQLFIPRFNHWARHLDSKNVKRLDTNETVIKSADGSTEIKGPIIEMKDNQFTRIKQGLDTDINDFIYKMWNKYGQLTVDVDSDGNVVVNTGTFKGDIRTDKNAKVGNNIEIGDITQVGFEKKITFLSNGDEQCSIVMDSTGKMKVTGYTGIDITSFLGDIVINSLGRIAMSGFNSFGFETVNINSTETSNIMHDGSGDFNLGHAGSGKVRATGTWDCSNAVFKNLYNGTSWYATLNDLSAYVSNLQSQINNLEARVTALEVAP